MFKYAATIALVLCVSCHALTPEEDQQYRNLINQGAQPLKDKNPFMAGGLNFLPGVGDHYLNKMAEPFWFDCLMWPLGSPFWAVPQALLTARNMNMRATIEHYATGEGKDLGFDPDRSEIATPKINP